MEIHIKAAHSNTRKGNILINVSIYIIKVNGWQRFLKTAFKSFSCKLYYTKILNYV